jgi:gluconolactonase
LRSSTDNDSKPEREETQQREQQMSETTSRSAGWQPATYYPDPAIHALDPRFEKYWLKLSAVERLATGLRWAEGPVWFGDGRYLLCSDIPNNRILKWEEETGAVSVYRKPSNFANGHTRDRQGRLIGCEHGGRRLVRTEHDGSITVLMDSFNGKRLNSPNDVVVKSDGSIWFTDPTFGLLGNYEGYKGEPEIEPNVYRLDAATGKATIVAEGVLGPNGLCFSPDEKILYVVESRGVPNRKILAYDVSATGDTISNKRVFIDAGPGTPDGMRCDIDGNLWCGWGMGDPELDGVVVYAPDGVMIGRIALPERCANRLFMAASQSIYALYINTQGALGGAANSIRMSSPRTRGPIRRAVSSRHGGRYLLQRRAPVIMGPCVRRDDTEFVDGIPKNAKRRGGRSSRPGACVKA